MSERIVPDGRMEMVFNLADPFLQQTDGRLGAQPRMLVIGEVRRPVIVVPAQRVAMLGVRFRPGGVRPFFPFPVSELTDSIIELESAWGAMVLELEEKLHAAASMPERIGVLESFLLKRGGERLQPDMMVVAAVDDIMTSGGITRIEQLAERLGISGRQLERRFMTTVGITPKVFSRIIRFQRVFKVVERRDPLADWHSIAFKAGYYDQAHFIRDFKEFAGLTPSAYFAQMNLMSEHFIGTGE